VPNRILPASGWIQSPRRTRVGGVSLDALPADYQRFLAIVREAIGPATVRAVGEVLVDNGELETALGKISQVLADLYRQASQLVGQSEYNRAVVSLISDAVREISNNLAYHLGLAKDVPLPPRVDVTGAMANLTQLHEARSQFRMLVMAHSGGQDWWRGRGGEPWLRWGRAQ
jgi:hypothetical protein